MSYNQDFWGGALHYVFVNEVEPSSVIHMEEWCHQNTGIADIDWVYSYYLTDINKANATFCFKDTGNAAMFSLKFC